MHTYIWPIDKPFYLNLAHIFYVILFEYLYTNKISTKLKPKNPIINTLPCITSIKPV